MFLRKIFFVVTILNFLTITSCGSIHKIKKGNGRYTKVDNSVGGRASKVLEEAYSFLGTPYKFGGTSYRGMDCSGLLWNAYSAVNIQLPRNSRSQSETGMEVELKYIRPGDALFFNTSGVGISHAGIVSRVEGEEIFFIHASSSRGVMISSLKESYWNKRFVKAIRYLH